MTNRKEELLRVIEKSTSYTMDEIENIYNLTRSIDKTIIIFDVAMLLCKEPLEIISVIDGFVTIR